MKNKKGIFIISAFIIVVIALILVFVLDNGMQAEAEYNSEYNKIFGEFTADTASQLLKDKKENTCYSPVSLFATLSMFAELTEGKTREEALKVLGFDSIEALEENYEKMLKYTSIENANSKITLANSFWVRGQEISQETQSVVSNIEETLDCEFFLKNVINHNDVNTWVNDRTQGLITDIVNSDEKKMLFANALYYKSVWAIDINKNSRKDTFHLDDGDEIDTVFLSASRENLFYVIEDDYTYVEVPLHNGSAVLVLPDEDIKLKEIIEKETLNQILASSSDQVMKKKGVVNISFPEFDVKYDIGTKQLYNILETRGASETWNDPDFIGELEGEKLEMVQKNYIKVNEDGIEAASATQMSYLTVGDIGTKIDLDITYNRPFLYVLIKDGVPLFIGTVYNPAE